MSRKSIFTVAGGAALGLLFAAGILWVELLAAEAEYVEEQEPVSPPVAEVIRQETPQEAAPVKQHLTDDDRCQADHNGTLAHCNIGIALILSDQCS